MRSALQVRPVVAGDYAAWLPLWHGYNAFYGRDGATALPQHITDTTWQRFFDPYEPLHALVAEQNGTLVGLAHYLFHRATTRIEPTCYLNDLFASPAVRRQGVGRALIEGVYDAVRRAGGQRVYWQTHSSNLAGQALYDQVARNEGFIVYAHML